MTKFEYKAYVLGTATVTAAAQYNKIKEDIANIKSLGWYKSRADKQKLSMLTALKAEFETNYQTSDLAWDEAAQHREVVHNLAKQSAVQLIAQGKVEATTMRKMASLPKDDFTECVKLSTKIASYLNHETKEAEKSVKPQDVVPEEFMN